MASFLAPTAGRLVDVAKQHLAVVAIDQIGPLIAAGAITIDGRVGKIADPVTAGAELAVTDVPAEALVPEPRELRVIHEDEALVIVDKPSGVHVHPLGAFRGGTLLNAMLWHAGARPDRPWAAWRPRPAHRLDRGASGLVVFAKHGHVHDALRAQLASGAMHRTYRARVEGVIAGEAGVIDRALGRDPANDYRRAVVDADAPGAQAALTRWRVVERTSAHTVVECELATGRTHQLRAHLASLGHPIAGDVLYGAQALETADLIELRAIELRLEHPIFSSTFRRRLE